MKSWKKMLVIALGGAAAAGALALAFRPRPLEVEVARARRSRMRVVVSEDGKTRVQDRYVVSAPLSGSMGRLDLVAGDQVRAGDVLARILPLDPPLLDARTRAVAVARLKATAAAQSRAAASTQQAAAVHAFSVRELDRARGLVEKGASARELFERAELEERVRGRELESAAFNERIAAHEAELARAELSRLDRGIAPEHLEVRAPVSGTVLRMMRESEGVIAAGAPILELGDPSALEVVVDVLTTDAVQIAAGARAQIRRWGGDRDLSAHVRRVDPSAFTKISALGVEEQRVDVVLDLDAPRATWAALGDGFRVEADIEIYERDGALVIPASAMFRREDVWSVFVVEDGRAFQRAVSIARSNGAEAEIREGLGAGDVVILHPGDRLEDETRVSVIEVVTREALAVTGR